MRYATTFGASRVEDKRLYEEGVELGFFLAKMGYTVKCGGYQGLMEAVSRGAREAGGSVVGICLEAFENLRENNPYLTTKIVARDLFERLKLLVEDSELFVVQQGSIGTLNELFLTWALKYSLGRKFRLCMIGKQYLNLKSCGFVPQEAFRHVEIFATLSEFKASFG